MSKESERSRNRFACQVHDVRVIQILIYANADFCYFLTMTDGSPPDVVFEGDSLDVIRKFPEDPRGNIGADLRRVQNGEKPLDSGSMAPILPGVFELRDEDRDSWYRVLYVKLESVV